MFDHRDIALQSRNLAILLEENRDAEITNEWQELLSAVRQAFYNDHHEAAERLKKLQEA